MAIGGVFLFGSFSKRCADLGLLVREWRKSLAVVSITYTIIALAAKFSQLATLYYSAQDFWLFDDMLRFMSVGQPYVTRFTGHGHGPVQHGTIHSFLTLWLDLPFVYIFGATVTNTAFNAIALGLAGWVLGHVTFARLKSPALAIVLPAAFYMSEWTSRVLMYESHPEALYPLLIFLVALPQLTQLNSSKKTLAAVAAWAMLMGIKQDAIFAGGVIWLWLVLSGELKVRHAALIAVVCAIPFVAQAWLIHGFKAGWGPHEILIGGVKVPVTIPQGGTSLLGGHVLSGLSDVPVIFNFLAESSGGAGEYLKRILLYQLRSPFIGVWLAAPWILLRRYYWILVMPLALLFAIFGGQLMGLQIYYPATVWATFLIAVIATFGVQKADRFHRAKIIWLFCFTAFYGANGPKYFHPSESAAALERDALAAVATVKGLGTTPSPLLGVLPRDQVWSERLLKEDMPEFINWVIVPKNLASYELSIGQAAEWKQWALASGQWRLEDRGTVELYHRVR
jgi:uncharacterized membrane protein